MTSTEIYLIRNNTKAGPFTSDEIQEMLSKDNISTETLAWQEGILDWQPLRTFLSKPVPPPIPGQTPPIPTNTSTPKGIRGWLLFFCVAITILGPIGWMTNLSNGWESIDKLNYIYPSLKIFMWINTIYTLALIPYSIYTGIKIWKGNPQGKKIAEKYLIIRIIFTTCSMIFLGAFLITCNIPGQAVSAGLEALVKGIFKELVFFAIWKTYFKKSKRVKNTYGPS